MKVHEGGVVQKLERSEVGKTQKNRALTGNFVSVLNDGAGGLGRSTGRHNI